MNKVVCQGTSRKRAVTFQRRVIEARPSPHAWSAWLLVFSRAAGPVAPEEPQDVAKRVGFLERLHLGANHGVRAGLDACLQLHHAGHSSPCCCPPPVLAEQFPGFAINNLQLGGEEKGRALSKAQQVVQRTRKRPGNHLGE